MVSPTAPAALRIFCISASRSAADGAGAGAGFVVVDDVEDVLDVVDVGVVAIICSYVYTYYNASATTHAHSGRTGAVP